MSPGDMILAWIDPDKEPTKHLLADLRQKKAEFGQWKGKFVMVFQSGEQMKTFIKNEASSLPVNITYSTQAAFPVKPSDIKVKSGELKNLPVVVFLDQKRTIKYLSEGYKIGIGDELLMLMH
jgi:hypothetical protein